MSIVKSGYCDLKAANQLTADEVLDIIEFEDISADIEFYNMEQ